MNDSEIMNIEVDPTQIPTIIQEQFGCLKELRDKVSDALQTAEHAQETAQNAKDKPAGLGNKKEAIKALQSATSDMADAQISAAAAQKASFEYQQKLGEVTKYLLGLGIKNLVSNRMVVKDLELRLAEASEEELDETARLEILSLVNQLNAQVDIMKKHEDLKKIVHKHDDKLNALSDENALKTEKLLLLEKRCGELEEKLQKNKAGKTIGILSLIVSLTALVMIIIQLFG